MLVIGNQKLGQTAWSEPAKQRGNSHRDPVFVPHNVDAVHATLRLLPSSGWTAGVFGRRDRCLLVLSQLAGVSYKHIASLLAGDISFDDQVVVIGAGSPTYRLAPDVDAVLCPACAVARWLEVLDIAVREIATVAISRHLSRADPVTPDSPHLCGWAPGIGEQAKTLPLLHPIDQWGLPVSARAVVPTRRLPADPEPRRRRPHRTSRPTRPRRGGHRRRPVNVSCARCSAAAAHGGRPGRRVGTSPRGQDTAPYWRAYVLDV